MAGLGRFLLAVATGIFLSCVAFAQNRSSDAGLIVHEWGTFTSIAGSNGEPVEWTPLTWNDLSFEQSAGGRDLEHYRSKELPGFVEVLHWGVFKQGLPATIRMETPVLYFYSRHTTPVSVHVKFAKGLITEWFPHAETPGPKAGLEDAALYRKHEANGSISWRATVLDPGEQPELPRDSADSNNRYYAARGTLSNAVVVSGSSGSQAEKFLFYRGVSLADMPLSAGFDGNKLLVRSSFDTPLPHLIRFERRGDRVGYHISDRLQHETSLDAPELNESLDHLYSDLEDILTGEGLYREEAHAMVQTWRDSWFEEGSRLFYIVPRSFVDELLPLNVSPAPVNTVRVFVGRLELISPATQMAVVAAMASNDQAALTKYGKFLEPILKSISAKELGIARNNRDRVSEPCRLMVRAMRSSPRICSTGE